MEIIGVYYEAMGGPDRPSFVPLQFKKGLETYRQVFEGDYSPRDLTSRLIHEINAAQNRNGRWVDEQLASARVEKGEPLLDVLLVAEGGSVIRSQSTYRAYEHNAQLLLDIPSLVTYVKRREEFVFPLTGANDAMLFWHRDHEEKVLESLRLRFGSIDVRDYSAGCEAGVRVGNIPRGIMGEGHFASEGIILGTLGFFVNPRLELGKDGPKNNIERVRFGTSRLNPDKTIFVSPLSAEQVTSRGGKLMDEARPNVSVVRVDTKTTGGDFIEAAISGTMDFDNPVVLRYAPLRPWLGEAPRRGMTAA